MAETSIRAPRGRTGGAGSALERFTDAVFVRDGIKFYLGDDGDFGLHYDNASDLVILTGAPGLPISDVDPAVSDALFLLSDTTSGKYVLAVSAGS